MTAFERIRSVLAISLISLLDKDRENKQMFISHDESRDIDKAIENQDWERVEQYIKKFCPSYINE